MKKRYTDEQIIGFLREAEAGIPIKDIARRQGFSEASFYQWRAKFGGMTVPETKRLKDLETENSRLKKLLAKSALELDIHKTAMFNCPIQQQTALAIRDICSTPRPT